MTTPENPWQSPSDARSPGGGVPGSQSPQTPGPKWHQPPMAVYPPYPGMGYGPPPARRPPMPDTVRKAVALIFTGMGLALLGTIVGAVHVHSLGDSVDVHYNQNGMTVYGTGGGAVFASLVGGMIVAGLWLWMALVCRAGRNWGRILSTVFFGFSTLGLFGLGASDNIAFGVVLTVLSWVVGLLAIILLWNGRSGPYFRLPPTYPYGYGPGAG